MCAHPVYPCFFFECTKLQKDDKSSLQKCAKGLIFDEIMQKCVWAMPWQRCSGDEEKVSLFLVLYLSMWNFFKHLTCTDVEKCPKWSSRFGWVQKTLVFFFHRQRPPVKSKNSARRNHAGQESSRPKQFEQPRIQQFEH